MAQEARNDTGGVTINLEAQEQRRMREGVDVSGPEYNQPWQKVTPEGLNAQSLLEQGKEIPEYDLDHLRRHISEDIFLITFWNFEGIPDGGFDAGPVIMDIVMEESGKVRAILQWSFDKTRVTENGENARVWSEARDVVDIGNVESAAYVVKRLNDKIRKKKDSVVEAREYEQALVEVDLDDNSIMVRTQTRLREEGLDDETIRVKQQQCLEEAGLDAATIARQKKEFTDEWKAERGQASGVDDESEVARLAAVARLEGAARVAERERYESRAAEESAGLEARFLLVEGPWDMEKEGSGAFGMEVDIPVQGVKDPEMRAELDRLTQKLKNFLGGVQESSGPEDWVGRSFVKFGVKMTDDGKVAVHIWTSKTYGDGALSVAHLKSDGLTDDRGWILCKDKILKSQDGRIYGMPEYMDVYRLELKDGRLVKPDGHNDEMDANLGAILEAVNADPRLGGMMIKV